MVSLLVHQSSPCNWTCTKNLLHRQFFTGASLEVKIGQNAAVFKEANERHNHSSLLYGEHRCL